MKHGPFYLILLLGTAISCQSRTKTGITSSPDDPNQTPRAYKEPELVLIGGGEFLMGCPRDVWAWKWWKWEPDELAQHVEKVPSFYLSRFRVTAEEYCDFLNEEGNKNYGWFRPNDLWATIDIVDGHYKPRPGCERSPAFKVNWYGADAYCRWLSKKTGKKYRLPTEAEWEYAARGPELRKWPWGNNDSPQTKYQSLLVLLLQEYKILRAVKEKPDPEEYGEYWEASSYYELLESCERAVGSFPRNGTPDGVFDLMGYSSGEWTSTPYLGTAGSFEFPPNTRNYIVKGAHQKFRGRESPDSKSWTRGACRANSGFEHFRLAMDGPGE